ncbi:hypothetical protein AnigIFM59636_002791 [Aspergillus niger]|nr:hypothetical protein AnigIFM59636_002791 [Aspergillus niger]
MGSGVMAYTIHPTIEALLLANETSGRPVLVQQGMTRESRLRSFAIEPKGLGIGVGEAGVDHVLYVLSGATLDLSDTYLEMPFPGKTILERRIPGKRQKPGVGEHGVRLLFGLGHEVPCLGGMESGLEVD